MNKALRDNIFYFFIFLFVFGTIILSLYASGYKFNLKLPLEFNRLLIKTGMLNVNSDPKSAKIFLNGKEIPSDAWRPWKKSYLTTPAKIKNLLPGNYELLIEKEGYWPFKTTLKVESGLTTFFEDVSLFKTDNPSIKTIDDELNEEESIFLSNNNRFLYLKTSSKIISLERDEEKNLKEYFNNINQENLDLETGVWLKNNELLLNGIFFSPRENSANKNFLNLIGEGAHNWKFNEGDNNLYYQSGNSLGLINIEQKKSEIILSNIESLIDYLVKDKSLFLIQKINNRTLIKEHSLDKKELLKELILPGDGDYLFMEARGNYLSIYDKQNKSLYFIETREIQKGYRKVELVNSWQWLTNNEILLVNDWELKHYNIQENRLTLLTRVGDKLEKLIINQGKGYLIILGGNKLMVYDLKTRFMTTILEAEKIKSPALDKSKDLLYFWGKLKEQRGIYRISIK